MYDLFPGFPNRAMSYFRSDRPVSPFTAKRKRSQRDERPASPVIDDGSLRVVKPIPHRAG